MAGMTALVTYDDARYEGSPFPGNIRKLMVSYVTDDSAGTATVTTRPISGELIKIVTDPGSTAPTDNWDVVLTDDEGVDLSVHMNDTTIAALIARDTANTEETYLMLEDMGGTAAFPIWPVVCGPLTIAIANAGNAKTLQVILYYRV